MPCIAIHLAVAKKYLEKHPEENYNDFINGTLAPDLSVTNIYKYIKIKNDDKESRHFSVPSKLNNVFDYMRRKVDFKEFFKDNDINTSFLRAYFLHLLCDYYFFHDHSLNEELAKLSLEESIVLGYNDYDLITPVLIKKYDLEIPLIAKDIMTRTGHGELLFLNLQDVYQFIDEMSNVDLLKEKIKMTSI